MWPGGPTRGGPPINYGLPPEMGMVGLRDVYVVAGPHHHHHLNIADHHSHHPHHLNGSNPATALGVGVIPLLTAAPCLGPVDEGDPGANSLGAATARGSGRSAGSGGGIQLWQSQQAIPQQSHFFKSPGGNPNSAASIGGAMVGGGGSGTASAGTMTCQDCGNQAKKDCSHRRCRTCCKSRGYECATHVKSTWVPAARRRERQLMAVPGGGPGSSGSTSGAKKPRLIASQTTTTSHTSTSNTTPPRSFDTSSSHQDASFKETLPGQVRAPAVFKCVRVTAVEDGEDEYAYQAVVKIGGHVFKGFLYDQGVESNKEPFPNLSELHLGGGGAGRNTNGGGGGGSSSPPILDPSDVYAASSGGFLQGGGSAYG